MCIWTHRSLVSIFSVIDAIPSRQLLAADCPNFQLTPLLRCFLPYSFCHWSPLLLPASWPHVASRIHYPRTFYRRLFVVSRISYAFLQKSIENPPLANIVRVQCSVLLNAHFVLKIETAPSPSGSLFRYFRPHQLHRDIFTGRLIFATGLIRAFGDLQVIKNKVQVIHIWRRRLAQVTTNKKASIWFYSALSATRIRLHAREYARYSMSLPPP